MQTLGSKILNAVIENEKINPNQFAESIGLSRTQPIYDILNGKVKKISSNYANKILSKYPHYNYKWLTIGEGEMLKEVSTEEAIIDLTRQLHVINEDDKTPRRQSDIDTIDFQNQTIIRLQKENEELTKQLAQKDGEIKSLKDAFEMVLKNINK